MRDSDSTVWRMASVRAITLLGQETFARFKALVSPTAVNDLMLDAIVQHLTQHFRWDTIEIAKRFKFFKRNQNEDVSATDYMGQLCTLLKRAILASI